METKQREHSRVSKDGKRLGAITHVMNLRGREILAACNESERDTCASCAFRRGTVPNGCLQTQMDAIKAVLERKPFMCHMSEGNSEICSGWFAAVQTQKQMEAEGKAFPAVTWEFSPPDVANEREVK